MSRLENYLKFTSSNPCLNFTFLYPAEWKAREIKGENYEGVFILGPRNQADTHSLSLEARVTPRDEEKVDFNLGRLIDEYLEMKRPISSFQKLAQARGYLTNVEAIEIEARYVLLLPPNNVNSQETPIVERRIFAQKGDSVYQMIYTAVEEDYIKYLEAFKEAVRSFEFTEAPANRAYWPLVTEMPVRVAHESAARYRCDEKES